MRGGGQQPLPHRHRAVDVDHHRNAAPDGLGAQLGAESARSGSRSRIAAQSSSNSSVGGSFTFQSSGSRKVTMVRSPVSSIMIAEIGVTRSGMWMRCLVSMPSSASLSKMKRLEVSAQHRPSARRSRRGRPAGRCRSRRSARCRRRSRRNGVAFSLEPRAGTPDPEGQVAHRHADAEDAGRDFRGAVLKIHAGVRHARFRRFVRNSMSGV